MIGSDFFIHLDFFTALEVVFLGFVGGVLSGFLGTGGAFFMTPGMMNIGVPGVIAVGSNITHKFGKSMMGARKHQELGHVDRKLGFYLMLTALIGVRLAVWINESLFAAQKNGANPGNSAFGDLYISALFIGILSIVGIYVLRDALRTNNNGGQPSTRLSHFLARFNLPPMITFKTANVTLSFWIVAFVGLVTGFLAGAVGIGGFVGVPAMIYAFGIPTAVAAGTEMFLAIFMGAFGAVNYAFSGLLDLRLTILLFLGSLTGIFIGAYGTKVVNERIIRLVTGLIIILSVLSRLLNVPVYLHHLNYLAIGEKTLQLLPFLSKAVLFASGTTGVVVILFCVARSYIQRRNILRLIRSSKTK